MGVKSKVIGHEWSCVLLAPGPSTIRNLRFEWRVADSATRSTEPTGRLFDLLELITPEIDLL